MKHKLILPFILLIVAHWCLSAKEYKVSLFGIKSDGKTNNTGSIRKAIDFISEQGGGTLVFYVGRYLTGTIVLKSDVSIRLEEGAILVGSPMIYDYSGNQGGKALLSGEGQHNITLSGKGVIEGQGSMVMEQVQDQNKKGYLRGTVSEASPALISLQNCRNITLDGLSLVNACGDVQVFNECKEVTVRGIHVKSRIAENTAGMLISAGDSITIRDSYFDVSGKEIQVVKPVGNISVINCINAGGKEL